MLWEKGTACTRTFESSLDIASFVIVLPSASCSGEVWSHATDLPVPQGYI